MPVASEIFRALGAYLRAQLRNAAIVAGLYIIAMALTGVPWWLAVGLVCGALHIVPWLGSLAALALALLVRWWGGGGWTEAALVGGAWLSIQIVDGFVLSPMAAGRAGVSPLLSIALVLAAGIALGPIAALAAVPAAAVILVVVRAWRRSRRPPSPPDSP